MSRALAPTALLALILSASGCNARTESIFKAVPAKVREPAVAGLFYPAQERLLAQTVDALLESAPVHQFPRLKALVCPHAGYRFSGQTAAIGYKTLRWGQAPTKHISVHIPRWPWAG